MGVNNRVLDVEVARMLTDQRVAFSCRFADTLEMADDMAIDIPHIWLYLAELVTPMLKEGGISMRELLT